MSASRAFQISRWYGATNLCMNGDQQSAEIQENIDRCNCRLCRYIYVHIHRYALDIR